ncbi:MAG: dihydroorotate dehydrogenase electron transfer subunit, partial [Clostridia bacterium]
FDFWLHAPQIARLARPGQFLHIRCGHSRLLRRPISICDIAGDAIRVVFEVRGEGTALLSHRTEGDSVDVLGPLGNGVFPDIFDTRPVLFVGGGIGAPPLLFAAKRCNVAHAVLGFKNSAAVILKDEFYDACKTLLIATDDGSVGAHGTIEKPMGILLDKNDYCAVMACGPRPMLRAAARLAEEHSVPCWVSMEERMGCGVGACLVCACKTHGASGEDEFSHVCKDGPVYPAASVIW